MITSMVDPFLRMYAAYVATCGAFLVGEVAALAAIP
jgi:hypothetical protein